MRTSLGVLVVLVLAACLERTEYRYRPEYVAINQGRPLEEVFHKPDGTRVVITSRMPGTVDAPQAPTLEAPAAPLAPGTPPPPLQVHTPDMVLEAFMAGLRSETYDDLWMRLVSPQQKTRMGEERGQETFTAFCRDNRRELMASCLKLCSSVRTGQAVVSQVGGDMTRYQLPASDREAFGFTIVEVERTPEGLRLAGIR
ncbi:MAG: hypothetical protein RLZZ558_1067 [Planctomycetota bacterium]|jgi:hypothetical protein